MLHYIDHNKMGGSDLGWLKSKFHFSFAEYYNLENMNFGILRVINDDLVEPGTGFEMHPHRDMEIVTYVVDGQLTHVDSMNNQRTLTRGQIQYMSAGTGVQHSEHNRGDKMLRLLQIWILPDKKGYEPNYGDYQFALTDLENQWLPLVTGADNTQSSAPVRIHADVNLYAAILAKGESLQCKVASGRQAYLVLIEGKATVGDITLVQQDGLEVVEEDINIWAEEDAHILVIEMAKG